MFLNAVNRLENNSPKRRLCIGKTKTLIVFVHETGEQARRTFNHYETEIFEICTYEDK